ncbi:hypothetical protein GOP47_0026222 [Adiantum capillus-veneris]|nr:hypothetical protein GOP47_0026222 [Adiantum capillus-veneris]
MDTACMKLTILPEMLKSMKLVVALGLQTVVTAPLVLHVLKLWNQAPIHISVEQMTKLYTWLWNEMGGHKDTQQFLQTESSIFVPEIASEKPNEPVLGRFVSPKTVVWRDETGCLSLMMSTDNHSKEKFLFRALNSLYPTLQPFFVSQCRVRDTLCFEEYRNLLRTVARTFRPHTVLDKVLKVFAMWSDGIDSGRVSSTDLPEWRALFQKADSKVFPTVQNEWVSLHSCEGTLCWCDDEALGKMFLGSKGIHFMCVDTAASKTCFGRSDGPVNVKVLSPFLQAMDILPFSKVVQHEAIPYGAQRSNYLMELFNWAVPYVQRYLQKLHPNVYERLQKAGVNDTLSKFTCLVCNQLFFCYKLPGELCIASDRVECNYLLEGDIFYAVHFDDLNGLFLEFSKLFFDKESNVQLANFLHLITLSVQSGSKETEIEALLASQGIDSSLESDANWTFRFPDCKILPVSAEKFTERNVADFAPKKARKFFSDTWPPRSLQHAVRNVNHRSHRLAACQKSLDAIMKEIDIKKGHKPQRGTTEGANTKTEIAADESEHLCGDRVPKDGTSAVLLPSYDLGDQVIFSDREQLVTGQPNEQHQELTGRLGEAVVFNHLLEKHGPELVTWMNAEEESGLPYDIVLKGGDGQQKLMEVKTTWTEDKDWFEMSPHEWELACRLGDRFVIVRVFLAGGSSSARFLWLPDPSQLCQQRLIKLALVLPRHNADHSV